MSKQHSGIAIFFICSYVFSFTQAIASVADRAERGLIGAKFQQDFAQGGLGEISPNKLQETAQSNVNLIVYVILPCLRH